MAESSNTTPWPMPSEREQEQAALAQAEVVEVLQRLIAEGFDWRCVITGAGVAIADQVSQRVGVAHVPIHFARMSALTMHLAGPSAPAAAAK